MSSDVKRHLRVPGIILANLYGRCISAEQDLEGLIFGTVSTRVIHSVNDAEANLNTVVANILIDAFTSTGSNHSFYDTSGAINVQTLEKLCHSRVSQGHQLLGWFKFRRHVAGRPSLLDATVQRELAQFCRRHDNTKTISSHPYFGLFTLSETTDAGLQFDYKFFCGSTLAQSAQTRIEIINLVNSSSTEYAELANAQSPFRMTSDASSPQDSFSTLSKQFLSTMPSTFGSAVPPPYVQETERFFVTTMKTMSSLVEEISAKEKEIKRLEAELAARKSGQQPTASKPPPTFDLLSGD
eukprot:TRINITY_DN7203_c0_g1_i1.p1 TRINITY_DN7203_c0_g1~~TRINITY_DN7203_c0_g1_i1.p1  ORF type:complete len:297 (+),score=33.91 TRINITY_DN7203_c0_g1_i1:53-943(+)